MPMVQRAANTGPGPSSARPHPAGLWRRPMARPLDFQRAVTIPPIQSSRQSTTSDGKSILGRGLINEMIVAGGEDIGALFSATTQGALALAETDLDMGK